MLKKSPNPASIPSGAWIKNRNLQPLACSRLPTITAPNETPNVKPVLIKPMNNPLRFFPDNSSTSMNEIVIMPAAPVPLITRPSKNTSMLGACDVTTPPIEKRTAAKKMHDLGEKTCASRAAIGEKLDIAI